MQTKIFWNAWFLPFYNACQCCCCSLWLLLWLLLPHNTLVQAIALNSFKLLEILLASLSVISYTNQFTLTSCLFRLFLVGSPRLFQQRITIQVVFPTPRFILIKKLFHTTSVCISSSIYKGSWTNAPVISILDLILSQCSDWILWVFWQHFFLDASHWLNTGVTSTGLSCPISLLSLALYYELVLGSLLYHLNCYFLFLYIQWNGYIRCPINGKTEWRSKLKLIITMYIIDYYISNVLFNHIYKILKVSLHLLPFC